MQQMVGGMQGVEGGDNSAAGARDEMGRATKTASGSRTQKSNTSYSLSAAQRAGPGSTSNEQFEDNNVLPQMAINRQQNMSGNSKRLGRMNN